MGRNVAGQMSRMESSGTLSGTLTFGMSKRNKPVCSDASKPTISFSFEDKCIVFQSDYKGSVLLVSGSRGTFSQQSFWLVALFIDARLDFGSVCL